MSKFSAWITSLTFACLLLIVTVPAVPTLAQDAPADDTAIAATCTPIDLIVILDQSNSMGTTDPGGLRVDAVHSVIDILFSNAALNCRGTTHRVGVIGFGDSAQPLIDLDAGSITILDPVSDWVSASDRLKSRVRTDALGNTSFHDALDLANRWFQSAPPPPRVMPPDSPPEPPRQRVLLMVTDGAPCTAIAGTLDIPELGNTEPCQNPDWIAHYLLGSNPQLSRYNGTDYRDAGFDFSDGLSAYLDASETLNSTSINVLLFTRRGQEQFVQPTTNAAWESITSAHDGSYFPPTAITGELSQNEFTRLVSILTGIISPRIGSERESVTMEQIGGECVGSFVLEPYSSSTTIIASTRPFENGEYEKVTLIQPDGTELPPTNDTRGGSQIRYGETRLVQSYTISDPLIGTWKIVDPTGVCAVEVTIEKITVLVTPPILEPIAPVIAAPYYQEPRDSNPNFITLTVRDSFNAVFNQIDGYPLTITGTIAVDARNPSAVVPDLAPMTFTFQGGGVWRSDDPAPVPVGGVYTVTLRGTTNSAITDGTPVEVFSQTMTYQTADPVSISLRVVSPSDNQAIPLNTLSDVTKVDAPFDVAVQFIDAAGNPQPLDQVFFTDDDRRAAVEVGLTGTEPVTSRAPARTISLAPSDSDPATLTGTFVKPAAANAADPEGAYALIFALTGAMRARYNQENYVLAAVTPPTVPIVRRELSGVKVVPITPSSAPVMLNNIVEGVPIELDIAVEVELRDETDAPEDATRVFVSDLNKLVYATLRNPDGVTVAIIPLQHSAGNPARFIGLFDRASVTGTAVGTPGDYTIRLDFTQEGADAAAFAQGGALDFAFIPATDNTVTFRRERVRGVEPMLILINGQPPGSAEGTRHPLNDVTDGGAAVAQPITIVAALADRTGSTPYQYLADDIDLFMRSERECIQAIVTGPAGSGIEESVWLTRGSDGRFTGELRILDDAAALDPAGTYTVALVLNPDVRPTSDQYVITRDAEPPQLIERFRRRGVSLWLEQIGEQAYIGTEAPSALPPLPLYASPFDAFNRNVSSIPVMLRLVDTATNESLDWQTIAKQVIPPATPPRPEATAEATGEATAEAIASMGVLGSSPATEPMLPALHDLVRVGVGRASGGDIAYISDLRQEARDGGYVLLGTLTSINDTDAYRLVYGLDGAQLDTVSARNFRSYDPTAAASALAITRTIGSLLYDPAFYDVLRPILFALLVALVGWMIFVNGVMRMSGEMLVTITKSGKVEKQDTIVLDGLRFRLKKRGRTTGAVVGRASGAQTAAGGGGALPRIVSVPATDSARTRTYQVEVAEHLFVLKENSESRIMGPYKASHRSRVESKPRRPDVQQMRRPGR